jgi:conjugal transfer mating pair stabilization protein TraN
VLGVCLEKKERHCCFNSKLARIINRQGRVQLGLPLNSCGGFNQAQLQALDFSRMDLSEFIADISPKDIPASSLGQRVQQTVNERVQGYYEQ